MLLSKHRLFKISQEKTLHYYDLGDFSTCLENILMTKGDHKYASIKNTMEVLTLFATMQFCTRRFTAKDLRHQQMLQLQQLPLGSGNWGDYFVIVNQPFNNCRVTK
jgi:hypothetical protein